MKKMYSALLISATLVMALTGCQKSLDGTPAAQNNLSQTGAEKILASENGVATAVATPSGDNVTLTLRPAKINGQDAIILKYDPDTSYANLNRGQEIDIPAFTWTAGGIPTYRRSLICFNQLSFIPAGATIVSAKLYLYGLPQGGSPNCLQGNSNYPGGYNVNSCHLQMCATPWAENTVTWNTQPSLVGPQIALPTHTGQWNVNYLINITSFVQNWMATTPPITPNYGMMIMLDNEIPYTSITFGSSENATAYRPKLVVVYHI